MRRTSVAVLAAGLALCAGPAWAQDAGSQSAGDAALPPGHPGLPHVEPDQPLPPGHPRVDGSGEEPAAPHVVQLPPSFAEETAGVAPGTIVVHVVDAAGAPVAGAPVRIGTMRDGERGEARAAVTGADGTARVEGLETGTSVAYRVSTDADGARFGAVPFQLPDAAGYRVQLVRFDVDHHGRAVLVWEARFELHFKDDRLLVVERLSLVNLSGMALGSEPARPVAYVPEGGLRFGLPEGYTAFNTAPSMSDVRVTAEGHDAVIQGSIPPTAAEPMEVAFQYQVKLRGGDVDVRMGLALPVVGVTVVSEAPRGLTLSVAGFPPAESREAHGQRVLLTGVQRRPDDPALTEVRIHLGGIPEVGGVGRGVAALAAAALVLVAVGRSLARGAQGRAKRPRAAVLAEREQVLAEAAALVKGHRDGDVGPVTYARRKRELALWLAFLLKEHDEAA